VNRLIGISIVIALGIITVGCDGGIAVQPVKGKLLLEGNPAPENTRVNFTPVGEGLAASGVVDAEGNYELFSGSDGLPGAVVGTYKVSVTADASSADYMDASPRGGVPGVVTGPFPKEYTSEFTTPIQKDVVEGENTIDIEIPQ